MELKLEISGRTVTVSNIEKLATGIIELHKARKEENLIPFGMLSAVVMEDFEKQITIKINGSFTQLARDIFSKRIDDFIRKIMKTITVEIYKQTKMLV